MNTPARLGVYGAGLVAVFAGAFAAADAIVPQARVEAWSQTASHSAVHQQGTSADVSHSGHDPASVGTPRGVLAAADGFQLGRVSSPQRVGEAGILRFHVYDESGDPVTSFATSHERELHLIVVRTDGTEFRHVHPAVDADGTWSIPWRWAAAGTYRIYTDFAPISGDPEVVTLTRTVDVAGPYRPALPKPVRTATVDGFTVQLAGNLTAGAGSQLELTVSRSGDPVDDLEPYLGAFGHLVALREGDLAFLHVHPDGEEPDRGDRSGPTIGFTAEAPTDGRYLLYLDFKVDGRVHTAAFVVDAGRPVAGESDPGLDKNTHDTDHRH